VGAYHLSLDYGRQQRRPLMTAILTTKKQIDAYRARVLLSALKLECSGMKRNGPSAYSIVKKEYDLKGNRESVYNQLSSILAA
jgi:hypothetical protein